MSKYVLAAAAVLLLGTATVEAAERCYPAVTGKAKARYRQATMEAAYREAILAWDVAAERKYQDNFNWSYSGERSISCKWKTGRDIVCTATARPCSP